MTTDPTINPDRFDEPLSDADEAILRAVETGTGGGHDADSSRLIAAMRRDREAVGVAVGSVPVGLFDRALDESVVGAESGLDLDAFRRLEERAPDGDRLPVSRHVPERAGVVGALTRNPGRVVLALAASLLVVLGGVALLPSLQRLTRSPATPIARHDPSAADPVITPPAETVMAGAVTADPVERDDPAPVPVPAAPALAVGTPVEDVFTGAGLLREGRLMILARGASSDRVRPGLDALAAYEIGPDHVFTIAAGMDESAMAALDLPDLASPVFAGDELDAAEYTLPERSVWTGRLRPTPNGLASLIEGLREAGLTVEMRALPRAVPQIAGPSADDVLWWGKPPLSWRRTVTAPVVVETLP